MDEDFKRFRGLHLAVVNDSGFTFTPSTSSPPVLDEAILDFEGTRHDSLQEIVPGQKTQRTCTLSLPDEAPIGSAQGLLTFDFGDPDLKLVVWLKFDPDLNAAGIQVGFFKIDKVFDDKTLKNLTPAAIEDGKTGFVEWVTSPVSVRGQAPVLGVGTLLEDKRVEPEVLQNYWDLDRKPTASIWISDFVEHPEWKKSVDSNLKHFEIAGGTDHGRNQPIHESLTITALAQADVFNSIKSENFEFISGRALQNDTDETTIWAKAQFEFIRGVVWNDDPVCLLFKDETNTNSAYSSGAQWFALFEGSSLNVFNMKESTLIGRSHFGSLQFLHSMASTKDEQAGETKRKILVWLEVMYKVAAGEVSPLTQLKETGLKEFFRGDTSPRDTATIRELLLGTTQSYVRPIYERRALGSCFHVIQDSYAVGHCKRHLINANEKIQIPIMPKVLKSIWDLVTGGNPLDLLRFKVGFTGNHWGNFSVIEQFHCYEGQDTVEHGKYDEFDFFSPSAENLNAWNNVLGARNAIEACKTLAKFASDRKKWDDGPKSYLDGTVFALQDPSARASTDVSI